MDFCPKCGTILLPKVKGDHTWSVCSNCGHYEKLIEEGYRFGEENKKRKRPGVAVIDEKTKRKTERINYDIDTDDCIELYEEY